MYDTKQVELEAAIADLYGREHAVFVGRGTTGFALVFEALGIDGEVLFPAYTCPAPAYGARYAGATPAFCDVSPQDYNATVETFQERMTDETSAVVPIHIFGHPFDVAAIQDFCTNHNLYLIEDACQIVGGKIDGHTPGSVGVASVVSFGPNKPIDAGGGGAVLTDDESLAADLRERAATLPLREEKHLKLLAELYRDTYYSIRDVMGVVPEATNLFQSFPKVFRDLYIMGYDDGSLPALESAIARVDDVIDSRRRNASTYHSLLDHSDVTHPDPRGRPVPYRYSVRLPDRETRDSVVATLREADFHVSTLYDPPLHRHFAADGSYPTAERLSDQTLNLWVTERVDVEYVERCAKAVLEAIEDIERSS